MTPRKRPQDRRSNATGAPVADPSRSPPLPSNDLASEGPDILGPPVVVEKLILQNIRSLSHLSLDLDPPRPEEGQWTVLLGENATGKSTLLRAVVLALRNLSDPQIWPQGTFDHAWRRFGVTPAAEPARITFQMPGRTAFETTIQKNGREVFKQSPERDAAVPSPCLLWGYALRRAGAITARGREVELAEIAGADVATLFDPSASVIHTETWLRHLQVRAIGPGTVRDTQILKTVFSALKDILELTEIDFDADGNVVVSGPNVGAGVPLAGLSDGYLTITGWVVDLIARWIERARRAKVPIDKSFPSKMTGLVLLDEIDLHLHPAWQLRIISRVRSIFPRLSFIVTTHNPLTLVGARPEEIRILVRTPEGAIRAEKRGEIPMTLTAGQLLGSFFGIDELYPDLKGAGRMLQRYGFLCGNPYRSEEEQSEMEDLRAKLAELEIHPGWTELPRVTVEDPPEEPESTLKARAKKAPATPAKKPRAPRSKSS